MRTAIAHRQPVDIAMVIDTLTRGGAERVLMTIANSLDPMRFRVHVITTRAPGNLVGELAPHVKVHSLNRRTRWDISALRRFVHITDEHGIRLIHTHSHAAGYFVRLARAAGRRRWLHVMHDHHGPVEDSLLLRLADRLLLRKVDHYFAVSDRLVRYAVESLGIPHERCERLGNGVDMSQAAPSIGGGPFTIAHLARVAPEKGHYFALAVAARLRLDIPDFRWLCIGSLAGPYALEVREEARRLGLEGNVCFLDERSDVAELLCGSLVGVLTSRWEGLPMALLEYMAAGLPVVVTDVGDCGRVVHAAGGGVVVACDDVDGFAAALLKFARDPDAAARAGGAPPVTR